MVKLPALKRAVTKHALLAAALRSSEAPTRDTSSSTSDNAKLSPPSKSSFRTSLQAFKRLKSGAVSGAFGPTAEHAEDERVHQSVNVKWEHFSDGMAPSVDDPNQASCVEQQLPDMYACAVGTRLPATGQSQFSIRIVASDGNGQSVLVGIAEETGAFLRTGAWGRSFGLAPSNGKLFGFPDARTRDKKTAVFRGAALMRGDLRGVAVGATIHMRVDMDERRLRVKVGDGDGDDWVLARDGDGNPLDLELSATPGPRSLGWRPFVRCANAGDKFALGATLTHTDAPPTQAKLMDRVRSKAALAQETPRGIQIQVPPDGQASAAGQTVTRAEHDALRNKLKAAKEQLAVLRRMYLAEKELRKKMQEARDDVEKRYEREKRIAKRLNNLDPEQEERFRRVKEIEAGLLREAILHNEKLREADIANVANAALAAVQAGHDLASQRSLWQAAARRASLPHASTYIDAFALDYRAS